ncbi:MAG: universal stress protein [Candidatus Spechtbacterales bacterium]
MLKRILVGLGGTEYAVAAINQGVALAMKHDAEVTGVSILDRDRQSYSGPVPIGGAYYARELSKHRLKIANEQIEWSIGKLEEACQAANIRHQVLREEGEPFELMKNQARYHDLMIFGLRSLFEFDLVPDPQDSLVQLVHSGVRPLIAVSKGYQPIKKVLIAYSGSMESAKAMKHFVQLRLWPDAQIRLITFEDGRKNTGQLLTQAETYCRAHGLEVETECLKGSPQDQLLTHSGNWGADLTVIGNSAKNLIMRRIFGETALHAIRNATQPLFLAQ